MQCEYFVKLIIHKGHDLLIFMKLSTAFLPNSTLNYCLTDLVHQPHGMVQPSYLLPSICLGLEVIFLLSGPVYMWKCVCVLIFLLLFFQQHVAPISDRDKQNPHIKFFSEKNPGWEKVYTIIIIIIKQDIIGRKISQWLLCFVIIQ